jgi:hypothetical protein
MVRPNLTVVAGERPRAARKTAEPEAMLAELIPELIRAEETVVALRGLVDSWRRVLATKRGVAFIREERVRQEFGQ